MLDNIDFSIDLLLKLALCEVLIFPFILIVLSRIPWIRQKNAQQFLWSFLVSFISYILFIAVIRTNYPEDNSQLLYSLLAYFSAMIIYLEIWALLSRGYTLGLLLTAYRSKQKVDLNYLAHSYRGGEGLEWIIRHRLSGLIGAKLIKNQSGDLSLTPLGSLIAKLYQFSIKILGLGYTG